MYFYNIADKLPIKGFRSVDFEYDLQTPQPTSFRITVTANGIVHMISDTYAGDAAKRNAALAFCIHYTFIKINQVHTSLDINEMITKMENLHHLQIYTYEKETAHSIKLKAIKKGRDAAKKEREKK